VASLSRVSASWLQDDGRRPASGMDQAGEKARTEALRAIERMRASQAA